MNKRLPNDAFAYYVALGPARSHQAVADRFDVHKRTVVRAADREQWTERLAVIEKEARDSADKQLAKDLGEMHLRHRKMLTAMASRAARALQEFPLTSGMEGMKGAALVIKLERLLSGQGRIQVCVRGPGLAFTDKFDVTNSLARKRFTNGLLSAHPGVDALEIDGHLDRIASEIAEKMMAVEDDEEKGECDGEDNEILLRIATDPKLVELFHSGARQDSLAYAHVATENHFENMAVRGAAFSSWLRHEFFDRMRRSPQTQAFTDAINTIESIALFEGNEQSVHLRVAPVEGGIVLDLCDDDWAAVLVTKHDWKVLASRDVPVRFIRRRGMLALPKPVSGGSIEELRPFVNIADGDQWVLYTCTLVSMFRPRGPYVIWDFTGEQGSAKSSTVKKTRALVDPNAAAVRRLPRDERDLMIGASNAYVLAFDNLSFISPSMSDALCSLATGGGFSTRQLFSDDEEKIIDAMRPVIMNGIEDVATRPDLLDRSILFRLPTIAEEDRREESELDSAFEAARPRILGALLEAASIALRRIDLVELERRPRMADFARFCVAAETGLGWAPGTFLAAYMRNRADAVGIALESSMLAGAVQRFMRTQHDDWTDSYTELLSQLERLVPDEKTKSAREWPRTGKGLSDALKRLAPALRAVGISVVQGERRNSADRTRLVTLKHTAPTLPSDGLDGSDDSPRASSYDESRSTEPRPDDSDGSDGVVQTFEHGDSSSSRDSSPGQRASPHTDDRNSASESSESSDVADAAAHEAAMGLSKDDDERREFLFDSTPLHEDTA